MRDKRGFRASWPLGGPQGVIFKAKSSYKSQTVIDLTWKPRGWDTEPLESNTNAIFYPREDKRPRHTQQVQAPVQPGRGRLFRHTCFQRHMSKETSLEASAHASWTLGLAGREGTLSLSFSKAPVVPAALSTPSSQVERLDQPGKSGSFRAAQGRRVLNGDH